MTTNSGAIELLEKSILRVAPPVPVLGVVGVNIDRCITLRREQEDPAEREQRLAGDRARVTLRREQEDPAERDERLAGNRARAAQRRRLEDEEVLPINTQMLNLHKTLSSIASAKCETCLECFPNLPVSSQPNGVIECRGGVLTTGTSQSCSPKATTWILEQCQHSCRYCHYYYITVTIIIIIIIIIIIRDCHRQRKC